MNVLYVITDLDMGGTERRLLRLLTHLDRTRVRPAVVSLGGGALADAMTSQGIPVTSMNLRSLQWVRAVAEVSRIARRHAADLIHGFLFHANMVGAMAGRCGSHPVLWSVATLEGASWHYAGYRLMRPVPRVVACSSEAVRRFFRTRVGMPADRLAVVDHGVDTPGRPSLRREDLGIGARDFVIATASRLDAGKGVGDVIDVVSRLREEHRPVTLLIMGDGTERHDLEHRARRAGIAERVRFLGWRDDVADVLSVADAVVHPSHLGEGMPNVVLEAMAAGRAVVATDVGGTRESLDHGETGFLIRSGDLQDLCDKIKLLSQDRGLLNRMGQAARKKAEERFTTRRMVQHYTSLYERIR